MENPLLAYAFNLLARRYYSVAEIRKKLTGKKMGTAEDVEKILERLKELKYLNDENYAKLWIENDLRRKPQGIRALKQKLESKGISKSHIAQAFEAENINELELAQEAAQKKLKTLSRLEPQKQKEKLYRFLASRGFKTDTIFQALSHLSSEDTP